MLLKRQRQRFCLKVEATQSSGSKLVCLEIQENFLDARRWRFVALVLSRLGEGAFQWPGS